MVINRILEETCEDDEIIVVDDHSEENYFKDLVQYATKKQIIIKRADKYSNRSNARNIGAKYASKDVLVFFDGDIIINDNSIRELRKAHTHRCECAFIGPKHYIHLDKIHFELYSGLSNYIEMLNTPYGRKLIMERLDSRDEREDFYNLSDMKDYFWMHYYTGACSVEREIFIKCGGFDETFTTWGSEDVDLGYRISKYGRIGFLSDFHSFHIPHNRDVFSIETTNMHNTLKMLTKYKTWEFEAIYAFNSNPQIIKSFLSVISQMRYLDLPEIYSDPGADLIINALNKKHPKGIIVEVSKNVNISHPLLGLAMPFSTKYFKKVCIVDTVFIYPMQIVSRIIQEALRVGNNVYIKRTNCDIRVNWTGKVNFPPMSANHKISYRSDDIMDYCFILQENHINIEPALPENVFRHPIFWENTHEKFHCTKDE